MPPNKFVIKDILAYSRENNGRVLKNSLLKKSG